MYPRLAHRAPLPAPVSDPRSTYDPATQTEGLGKECYHSPVPQRGEKPTVDTQVLYIADEPIFFAGGWLLPHLGQRLAELSDSILTVETPPWSKSFVHAYECYTVAPICSLKLQIAPCSLTTASR
ncbi:unnamed protein product, partial [Ascophyllum nodosum]